MIIDDDRTVLELEALTLKRAGNIQIRACENGEQAAEALRNFSPDIILLDLKMPGKDGTDVLRDLRQISRTAQTPVIFVTGEEQLEMREEYKVIGVLGIVQKPFKPSELVMTIQKLWQVYRFSADS